MERRYTVVDGWRIHSLHGGEGAPVVLLHGLSGSHRWWRSTVPALRGLRSVHVPELMGFGESRTSARLPTIAGMAELLISWLDALSLDRVDLVGHSMGGQLSMHLAAKWPDRIGRLVLVSAAGVPRRVSLQEAARLVSGLVPPRAWGRPSFLPTIAGDALRSGPRALLQATRHLLADDVLPLLPQIRSPTLLVWGQLDPLTPLTHAWVLADGITGSQLAVIPDAAHNPMVDRPEAFNRLVLDFLEPDE